MGSSGRSPVAAALLAALCGPPAGAGDIRFEEVAKAAGLAGFRHTGGTTPEKRYIAEVMSGGACVFDADEDGSVDVFLVNGGTLASVRGQEAPPPHALFRNRGDGTFEDWTARSGIRNSGWGMGCVAADYDGDGLSDLYVTAFQSGNRLYRNRGRGAFEDVTAPSGTAGPPRHWSAGAAFADYDADGDLDLFVAGYVALDLHRLPEPGANRYCRHHGLPVNCGPRGLPGEADLLFRNEGGGRFSDVSAPAGVSDPERLYGLGALFLPLGPGERPSLVVANDSTPNFLHRPRPGSRFEDEGMASGLALSEEGNEQASMGIAWGDYDGDGALDLYFTHFVDDYNTLYRGRGGAAFEDTTRRAQLAQPTWLAMGWGTAFADFDRDGRPDLVAANGHVYPQVDRLNVVSRYRMPVQVFRNAGDGTFVEQPQAAPGEAVGRGLALGDFWNDGRPGFVVNNLDGAPSLFRNRTEGGRFVSLRLEGTGGNRGALGARVAARWSRGRALAVSAAGGSYLSCHDPRLHLGVGAAAAVDLEVEWPSGARQRLAAVASGRFYRLKEGAAIQPVPPTRSGGRS